MFDNIQPPASTPNQPIVNSVNAAPPQSQQSTTPSNGVYTMPTQFLPPKRAGSTSKRSTKKIILIVSIIVAIFLILTAIIVYAFMITAAPQQPTTNQNDTTTTGSTNTVTNANTDASNTSSGSINASNDNAASANSNAANTNASTNSTTTTNGSINTPSNTATGTTINTNVSSDLAENINEGLFPDNSTNSATNNNNTATDIFLDHSDVVDTRDKDRDSLTDTEEEIYGTTFSLPDTDKDGYIDGVEVKSGYSPTEPDKTLVESGLAIKYKSKEFGWNMLYPSEWVAEPINETKREVRFTADTVAGEFVDVIVMDNAKKQSAAEWFAGLYENVEPQDLQNVRVGGLNGIVSPDGFMYYLANEEVIVGIIYNFGSSTQISFRTTFTMMINSFEYKGPKEDNTVTQ